jgi:aspartate 1-decarboxylase
VPAEPPQSVQPQYSPATIRPEAVAEPDQGIQISGVVQIGSTVSAIVRVSGESARYVSEGDTLANGRIRVHKIEMGGQEPRVILEQDGTQIVRTVGSSASADTF